MEITYLTNNSISLLDKDNNNWRRGFANSEEDRAILQTEYPDIYNELCGEDKPWGTEATVEKFIYPTIDDNALKIKNLKEQLSQYDYRGIKIAMGVATKEEYADKIAITENLRQQIRELE